jgi:hypothetical protein
MRFPNLVWALSEHGFSHWKFAGKLHMEPTTFSRRLNGRGDFTLSEREKIATLLVFPAVWLFQEPTPPIVERSSQTSSEPIAETHEQGVER